MNDAEVKRLAHAINELRPSWPISSLTSFISRNLSNRVYRDAAVALTWVALDADMAGEYISKTPKRVLEAGPWWRVVELTGGQTAQRFKPPKKHEECRTHPGQYPPPYCGPCATENTPAYYDDPDVSPVPSVSGVEGVRAVLRKVTT